MTIEIGGSGQKEIFFTWGTLSLFLAIKPG